MLRKVDKISLQNFGCFVGRHSLEIGEAGLYYVSGKNLVHPRLGANGIGKSTLFNGLYWAWTGKTISDSRPGASIEPWQVSGPVRVLVYFRDEHEEKHILRRERRPNRLSMDGQEITQDQLADWLGLSEDNFRRTILIGQEGELFLDLRPEEQSRMFTDMLDLNVWLQAADRAGKEAIASERRIVAVERSVAEAKGKVLAWQQQLEQAELSNREFRAAKLARMEVAEAELERAEARVRNLVQKKVPALTIASDISAVRENVSVFQEEVEDCSERLSKLREDMGRITAEEMQYEREYKRYEKIGDLCPECGQEVDEQHIRRKMQSASKRLDEAHNIRQGWQKQIDVVLAKREELRAKLTNYSADLIRLEREGREASDEIRRMEDERVRLRQDAEASMRRLNEIKEITNPHGNTIKQLKGSIADEQAYIDKLNGQIEDISWELETCKYWQQAFREIRLNLIDDTLLEIEIASNRHAEALGLEDWRIEFATERTTQQDKVSRGFTTLIHPPEQADPVRWERYSGGEVQRWRLAVTFALSEILLARAGLNPNIEILDEPSQHLSTEGIDDLLEALRDRALDLNRAIYFVDHRSLDRGAFDGVVMIERDRSGSRIVA